MNTFMRMIFSLLCLIIFLPQFMVGQLLVLQTEYTQKNKVLIHDHLIFDKNSSFVEIELQKNQNTKISGFWDYQSNGGAINYIEMNPTDANKIHTLMMVSTDSGNSSTISMSRRVVYNYSDNGGVTWGNPVSVPGFRAGYPSLIFAKTGNNNHVPVIANHSSSGSGIPSQSVLFIDRREGSKIFSAFYPPLQNPGFDDALWPIITQSTNGNIILAGSFPTSSPYQGISVITLKNDSTWSNWERLETSSSHAGRIAMASGNNGRVAIVWRSNTNPDSLILRESTNNGLSWNPKIVVARENGNDGPCWTGFDAMYFENSLMVVYTSSSYDNQGYKLANRVRLWNSGTGLSRTVIDSITFPQMMKTAFINKSQTNHNFAFNFPSLGKNQTSTRVYVAVDAFLQDVTDPDGFNYSDILLTYSDDGGINWKKPINITNTNTHDERYVSISTINPVVNYGQTDSNYVYLVFQEDKIPGANFVTLNNEPESRPVSRAFQKFMKINIDKVSQVNVQIPIISNWNMISLPVNISDSLLSIFPTALSRPFSFSPISGYDTNSVMFSGKGYWIKFGENQISDLSGPQLASKVINVLPGWNLIGSITYPVTLNNIIQNPPAIIQSPFFEYANGYVLTDTLQPGKAYWVKINSEGTLNLVSP